MKKIFTLLLACLAYSASPAQHTEKSAGATKAQEPAELLEQFNVQNLLFEQLLITGEGNADSSGSIRMLSIAQELNNDSLLAISYNLVGNYFCFNKGDNTTGLEYLFKAIPLAEQARDKRRTSSLYFDIGRVYLQLHNTVEALKYNRKGALNLPDPTSPMYNFMVRQYQDNMTNCFLLLQQPDSALHYVQALNETNLRLKSRNYDAISLRNFGMVYEQLGDNDIADMYYKKAIKIADSLSFYNTKLSAKESYTNFLLKTNNLPHARVQALQLLQLGNQINNNDMKLAGAGAMRRVYDKSGKLDSAYFYSRLESAVNASIFSEDNLNKIQSMEFSEKLRTMEEADRLADESEQRRLHIQFVLIAFGIIAFIILLLLLSRTVIANKSMIEFLGVVALLIVFEFVNLLMHPFLERVTNHSPVMMLLALVCIAALLVPLHHRIEKWATTKLVEKNKLIRLAAAQRTIASLDSEKQ